MTRIAVTAFALAILSGCETVNLSRTVAGGACGEVDYHITIFGTPAVGVRAERSCEPTPEPE